MNDLIKIAKEEIGVTEISGEGSNPRILQYAKEVGFDNWYKDDDTAWCSLFMNWVAMKAGLVRSFGGRAASWQTVGQVITEPEPGDIALFSPTAGGTNVTHVGIFMGYSADKSLIKVLGGNQSDMVNITNFNVNTLVEFRRLSPVDEPIVDPIETPIEDPNIDPVVVEPEPEIIKVLRRGDRGAEVVTLQNSLNSAGFNCGRADGIFGRMTEAAVFNLQNTNLSLTAHGVYDGPTRTYLMSLVS